jgi:chromosome partitioning protein
MDVLALYSTKGGCGKTTLAAHLAVEAERQKEGPVAVIDADPQASLARWWNCRQADTPAFVQTSLAEMPKRLDELNKAGVRLVLIDCPGADVSHSRGIIKLSNLVIIPSRPSPLDLGTLGTTVGAVEGEGKPLLFVLNAVTARTRISTQAVMALSQHGPVAALLHQRTDYASSMTDGRVASELDPNSKSALEIEGLFQNVLMALRKQSSPSTTRGAKEETAA